MNSEGGPSRIGSVPPDLRVRAEGGGSAIESRRSSLFEGIPRGMRILCVDDESMIGNMVGFIMRENLQMQVDVAHTGLEALHLLEKKSFDLIIVDYVMPEMDGGELYREMRRRYPELLPRVMFITGDTLSDSTLGFIASTGRRLLEKPFGLPEITNAIREMLVTSDPVGD